MGESIPSGIWRAWSSDLPVSRKLEIIAISDTEIEIRVVGLDGKTRTCKLTVE